MTDAPLTPELFTEDPARDERFTVKEKWKDCPNLPGSDPMHQLEFFQRQMNEELNSIESSARCLVDFPDADWELRMEMARQCADEARHAVMFRQILESRGGYVGQFPVLNFQYRIISNCPTLIGRLAIQNRSFEAGGIDAITYGIDEARAAGDHGVAALYEAQLADEVNHVRFANEWIRKLVARNRRHVMDIGAALTMASKAFFEVMGKEGTEGVHYPIDAEGRLDAGFTLDEIKTDTEIHNSKRQPQEQPAE